MISVIYIYVLGKTHTGYFKQLLLSHMTHLCQMGLKCFVKHCLGLFYEELLACVRPIWVLRSAHLSVKYTVTPRSCLVFIIYWEKNVKHLVQQIIPPGMIALLFEIEIFNATFCRFRERLLIFIWVCTIAAFVYFWATDCLLTIKLSAPQWFSFCELKLFYTCISLPLLAVFISSLTPALLSVCNICWHNGLRFRAWVDTVTTQQLSLGTTARRGKACCLDTERETEQ